MPGLRPALRVRSFQVRWWAGLLLGVGSLAAVSLEGASFGHVHVGHGHRLYHHHPFSGAHEHSHPHPPDPPSAPSKDRGKPHRTATIPAVMPLFHPVATHVLAAPWVDPVAAVADDLALPSGARPAPCSGPPRAPPAFPRYPP